MFRVWNDETSRVWNDVGYHFRPLPQLVFQANDFRPSVLGPIIFVRLIMIDDKVKYIIDIQNKMHAYTSTVDQMLNYSCLFACNICRIGGAGVMVKGGAVGPNPANRSIATQWCENPGAKTAVLANTGENKSASNCRFYNSLQTSANTVCVLKSRQAGKVTTSPCHSSGIQKNSR